VLRYRPVGSPPTVVVAQSGGPDDIRISVY